MKRTILLALIALLMGPPLAGLGHAQTATDSSKIATVSPAARAAARELADAMQVKEQFRHLFPIIMDAIKPALVKGDAQAARDFDDIKKVVLEAFTDRIDKFVDAYVLLYARHFTVEELHEAAEFMKRPVGRKFIEKLPVISREGMEMGQRFGAEAAADIQRRMTEELRKRGHKL